MTVYETFGLITVLLRDEDVVNNNGRVLGYPIVT